MTLHSQSSAREAQSRARRREMMALAFDRYAGQGGLQGVSGTDIDRHKRTFAAGFLAAGAPETYGIVPQEGRPSSS